MGKVNAKNIMNGSYGSVRVDGIEYANIQKFEAKVSISRESIQLAGSGGMDSKMLSSEGSGAMTFKKVNSRVLARHLATVATGKDLKMTLIVTLDDPDGVGRETVSITDVWLNDFDVMNFETGAVVEENVSFGFNPSNIVPLDLVIA